MTTARREQRQGPPGGRPMGGGPGMHGMGVVVKAKDFKGSGKKLLAYLAPFKWWLVAVLIFAATSTVFTIVGPKILSRITDELARGIMSKMAGGAGRIDFDYIGRIVLILAGLYLTSAAFSYLQGRIMADISTKVAYNMRNALMRKINRLPLSYFNRTSHGEVLSRITNDVDTLNMSLSQSITQIITSSATLVGVLIMMLSISPLLTLVALGILPISLGLVMGVVRKSQQHFVGQQKYLGAVNGHVEEMYGGHVVVKAFNGEERALAGFDAQNDQLYESAWKAQFLSGLMMPMMVFVGNLGYVVICIVGAAMAAGGRMTIGGIQAFIQYVRSFTQPISQMANISNQLQMMVAAAERVFEFLEEREEPATAATMEMATANIRGDVTFDHVKFGYEDTDKIVIHDFSAEIKAGQKVAIVGPTGAGKTTLVKLLMRFHDLQGGAIYVDGHDITSFARRDLRSEFGMVLQDTWLFNGTIMDNVRYSRREASDDEVAAAAQVAQADHFIRTLPESYHMELNEEASNLSQGEKQLLTIARAVLADSQIMILDEATSSVDTRTEILIQRAMDELTRGRTSFIIAHRLSTIRNADLILCLNEGDIVEQGTHEELLARGGFYANMYNSQFDRVAA